MSADLFAAFGPPDGGSKGPPPESSKLHAPEAQSSQDIFCVTNDFNNASLDDFAVWNQPSKEGALNLWNRPTHQFSGTSELATTIEDDEWGEFEDATSSKSQQTSTSIRYSDSTTLQTVDVPGNQTIWDTNPSLVKADKSSASEHKTYDAASKPVSLQAVAKTASHNSLKNLAGNEVLFDADEEIDDFGDFETGVTNTSTQDSLLMQHGQEMQLGASIEPSAHQEVLISISVEPPALEQTKRARMTDRKSASSLPAPEREPTIRPISKTALPDSKSQRNKLRKKSAFQPIPSGTGDDTWEDFEETSAPELASEPGLAPTLRGVDDDDRALALTTRLIPPLSCASPLHPNDVPPTNIPPPAILLSIFPSLIEGMYTSFLQPLAALNQTTKTMTLSHVKAIEYLQGCLSMVTTAAHIIAGRKQRWKRDTLLSQGMRIGLAGRSGGMKLTGIDKSESNKEEREVLDVIRAWQGQAGRLRSAITAAQNASKAQTLGTIPDIQETMTVKTAKQLDGGVPAPRQCALCGLKRDERVLKVDNQVQDSFGEWWIDQVSMHKDCRNFWVEQKGAIQQR